MTPIFYFCRKDFYHLYIQTTQVRRKKAIWKMHFSKTCAVFCQLSEVHCPIIDYRLSWSFRIQSMFCREMRKCLHSNIKIQDTCLESRAIFFFNFNLFFFKSGKSSWVGLPYSGLYVLSFSHFLFLTYSVILNRISVWPRNLQKSKHPCSQKNL